MKKLLLLGVTMSVVLAACGSDTAGLEGNSYELEIDGVQAGVFEFGSDGELNIQNEDELAAETYEVDGDGITLNLAGPEEDTSVVMILTYDDIEADVIEGEVREFNLIGEGVPEEHEEYQDELNEMVLGTPYTLTKVEE